MSSYDRPDVNLITPVSQQANWSHAIKKEIFFEQKWRQREADRMKKELGATGGGVCASVNNSDKNAFSASLSLSGTTTKASLLKTSPVRETRDEIAEQSLNRFPPRRADRTTLKPLEVSRGCTMPELPRHMLSRASEIKSQQQLSHHHDHHHRQMDAFAFQSTHRTVYAMPLHVPHAQAMSSVAAAINKNSSSNSKRNNNATSSSSSSLPPFLVSGTHLTEQAVSALTSRDDQHGRKPMIKTSFFRRYGVGLN